MARKSKKKKPEEPLIITEVIDTGTPELRQHFQVEDGKDKKPSRVLNHPLDLYLSREDITREQYYAGCRLFNDYEVSHNNRNTMSMLGIQNGLPIGADYENPHTCFERYMRVIGCLNHTSKKIAFAVCIEGKTMSEVKDYFTWWSKRNTGIDRMCETLDELQAIYDDERRAFAEWREKKMEQNNNLTA